MPDRPSRDAGRVRLGLTLAGLVLSQGCEKQRQITHADVTVRDSAGIEIVENPATSPRVWELGEPRLEVGVAEGDPDYLFSDVGGALLTSRGELAVADRGSNSIRFYDGDGRFLRSTGGDGDGPGEFRWIGSLRRQADFIVAFDRRRTRFSWFDSAGAYARATPPDAPYIGFFDDGSLLSPSLAPFEEPAPGSARRGLAYVVRHLDGRSDTIAEFLLSESWVDSEIPGFSQRLFARNSWTTFTGNRLFIGDNASYEIREYSREGRLVRIVRRDLARRPVTDSDRDRLIAAHTERFAGDPRMEVFLGPLRRQPKPEYMPAFGRSLVVESSVVPILVDEQDRLWVQSYVATADETPQWSVYDPQGKLLGELTVPVGFDITFVGDGAIVGRWRDPLGIEYARVYAFTE